MNKEYLEKSEMISRALSDAFPDPAGFSYGVVYEAMRYATLNGGKRLRGVLMLAVGELCGLEEASMLPFACAIEMIHASTLIHDDLPCMDDDDFRRGQPSCHKKFGEDIALLAGDALYSYAFSYLCRKADRTCFTEAQILDVIQIFLHAGGADGVIGGQILDKMYEKRPCTKEQLLELHGRKTGALFSAISEVVCILAQPSPEEQKAVMLYMKRLGLAFQIKDDLLDETGDFTLLGKATHADQNKSTFVTLTGVDGSEKYLHETIGDAQNALSVFGDAALLLWIADFVENREK